MVLECKTCEALVEAISIQDYKHVDFEEHCEHIVTLLKCPKCSGPFLIHQEDYGQGPDDLPDVLYPVKETRINPSLPDGIKSAYTEAVNCLRGKSYTAAAIMCRKTLEGICAEHNVTEKNLGRALKQMKELGIIEKRLYDWADALRISGNEAAHDVKLQTSAEDARDIVEFTNALLEYVFTFRDKFDAFNARRAKKANP
ncbi:MAG: DUF4145 domain-containing protein [Thermoanaerobaculia bacterium]